MTKLNRKRLESLLALGRMIDSSLQEITDYTLEKAIELTKSDIGYLAFLNEDETIKKESLVLCQDLAQNKMRSSAN